MKTGEKRDVIVREIIKPLLKERGFRSKKTDWWKELSDGYLFIHMKNSLFNSAATGYCFCFQFSAAPNAQISGALEKQWIANQPCCLAESAFLPYCGYLSPNRTPLGYQIDGYRDYAPTDVAVEEIASQVKNDFTEYILPEIEKVHSVSDFQHLLEDKKKRYEERDVLLCRYYSSILMLSCSESNLPVARRTREEFGLTAEEIRGRYDWLTVITKNSAFPHSDARPFIEKLLEER